MVRPRVLECKNTFLENMKSFLESACDICVLHRKNYVRAGALLKKTRTIFKNGLIVLEN